VAVKVVARRGKQVALFIRRLPKINQTQVGTFTETRFGGIITPANRRLKTEWVLQKTQAGSLKNGDLVLVRLSEGNLEVKEVEYLGREDDPSLISLIAIYTQGIPVDFPPEVLEEAAAGKVPPLGKRVDLRNIPLVTIDGSDARDFDDAVYAQPDEDPRNPGGWKLLVAIADVSHYVPPFSLLDQEARRRGNSVYFPDRVVPMLPEVLSNGLCSLQPHVDRACVAVELIITAHGHLSRHKFMRGLMRSAARFTYQEIHRIHQEKETHHPLWASISSLYLAYEKLSAARQGRGALELELPEYKVNLDKDGCVSHVYRSTRLPSHQLIEEFMICANVAAAQALEQGGIPCMYRVHEGPDPAKIVALGEFVKGLSLEGKMASLPTQVQARHLNQLLEKVAQTPLSNLLSEMVLRSQSQARYSPENIGHFGLHLTHYAHFTSPIRRYADLLVHRGLLSLIEKNEEEFPYGTPELQEMADHISMTERRAVMGERETMERYLCHFLEDQVGATFDAYISTVTKFALFVTLAENGANGIIPIENLGRGPFRYEEKTQTLKAGGTIYHLGQFLPVTLKLVHKVSGRIELAPASQGSSAPPPWIKAKAPRKKKK
jgi:ribonuclease R